MATEISGAAGPSGWVFHRRVWPRAVVCVVILFIAIPRYLEFSAFQPSMRLDQLLSKPVPLLWFVVPLAATAIAWEAGRVTAFHRSRSGSIVRSSWSLFVRASWPYIATVIVAYCFAFVRETVWAGGVSAPLSGPPLTLLLVAGIAATALGPIAFGWWFGCIAPRAVSVPGTLLVILAWIVVPGLDSENYSWRNITGFQLDACCSGSDSYPVWESLVAPMLITVVVGVGGVWLLTRRVRWVSTIVWVSASIVCLMLSINLVDGVGALPFTKTP